MNPRVKVCGITRIDDALLAAELGASALGFVFWPGSPRFIEPDAAHEIVAALPAAVVCVGVFVDQDVSYLRHASEVVPLGAVQLHGHESVAFAEGLMTPVIKAVPVDEGFDPASIDALPSSLTVLLDAHDPARRGGTGRTINWQRARLAARRRPVVLAGGLTPENVAEAVDLVRPYAVDVSSGVEDAPGVKDPLKMAAFFKALGELKNRIDVE